MLLIGFCCQALAFLSLLTIYHFGIQTSIMKNLSIESNATKGASKKRSSTTNIFNRKRIINNLDNVQDLLVIFLCIALLIVMTLLLFSLFISLQAQPDFKKTISDMLFLLILVELFRLMMVYLEGHHISIGVAVEVTLVSVLREIIVEGIIHIDWVQIAGVCAFIVSVSLLLYVEAIVKAKQAEHPELDRGHGH